MAKLCGRSTYLLERPPVIRAFAAVAARKKRKVLWGTGSTF